MVSLGELLEISLEVETTKLLLDQCKSIDINNIIDILTLSKANNLILYTYDDYKTNFHIITDTVQPFITAVEYNKLLQLKPIIDKIIFDTFKLLI